ncbi:MAG: thiamine biosynthesis lipoprotein [Gammaproteobacteria bacterium]|jgi:thiamine biosynthesis lipoprotein
MLPVACNSPAGKPVNINGMTMGTVYSVTLPSEYLEKRVTLEFEINSILEDINQKMSTYIGDSELSIINQSTNTEWITISEELYQVIQSAQAVSEQTNGAFDITIGAIVNLWGFGSTNALQTIPDTNELDNVLQASGHKKIQLNEATLSIKRSNTETKLDLSGIAKGYAVDRIAMYLEQQGIDNYLVEIGGEVKAKGLNSMAQTWRVGIEKPLVTAREIQQVISLNNMAMATSGDYRNFFNHNGIRYSHTIDPTKGWPVIYSDISVTVLNKSSMIADALATAIMVMGPEHGFNYAISHDIPALFIMTKDEQLNEYFTDTFIPYLVKN